MDNGELARGGSMKWFRFYSEALHDPKVQRLNPELFRFWVNLLCLANEGKPRGMLPAVADIAFVLRIRDDRAARFVDDLTAAGLLDLDAAGRLTPHNWSGRQHKSDDVAERVKKHRERHRETLHETLHETPLKQNETPRVRADSEPDTEPDSEENPPTPGGGGVGGSETDPAVLEITRAAEDLISGFGRMAGNACRKYPPAWVDEAVRITADARKSRWNYTQGILDRFQTQGHSDSDRPARASPSRPAQRQETPEEKHARHERLKARLPER